MNKIVDLRRNFMWHINFYFCLVAPNVLVKITCWRKKSPCITWSDFSLSCVLLNLYGVLWFCFHQWLVLMICYYGMYDWCLIYASPYWQFLWYLAKLDYILTLFCQIYTRCCLYVTYFLALWVLVNKADISSLFIFANRVRMMSSLYLFQQMV